MFTKWSALPPPAGEPERAGAGRHHERHMRRAPAILALVCTAHALVQPLTGRARRAVRVTAASPRVQPQPQAFLAGDSSCAVPSSNCKWLLTDGKCSPACRNVNCGFISCDCEPIPSLERPPWRLLNVSYDACPQNVQEAFVTTAVQLQPDKNPDCVGLARRELLAARKARDVLLELITENLAAGGSCDSEADARTVSDPWTKSEDMGGSQQPLLPSAWRSARRWLGERMRALRRKAAQHSPWLALASAIAIQALAVMGLV